MWESNLAAEADELAAQLDRIRRVLDNIEGRRGSVRPEIYEKVRAEYVEKLGGLRDRIRPLLDRTRQDLHELAVREAALLKDKERADIDLEEVEFRLAVEDLDPGTYDERKRGIEERLSAISGELAQIGQQVSALNALAARLQLGDLPSAAEPIAPQSLGADAATLSETEPTAAPAGGRTWNLGEELVGAAAEAESPADLVAEEAPVPQAPVEEPRTAPWEREFFREEGRDEERYGIFRILQGVNAGKVYTLSEPETKIGRDLDNHIQILDPKISRHHFVVERRKRAYLLRDQESANGTFVNNRRVDEIGLSDGDEIRIGGTIIQFELPK